ncbi:MAG: ethylbenzene dehydrogenase-related protein [Dehalococcoidia bacterium]|jgi:hypothetical protein|nr:ethylbenzene dehydrogenase-related protein [Dehalococcoidia bacterium]
MDKRFLFLFVAALLAVSALATTLNMATAAAVDTEVVSTYIDEDLPLADPNSPMWDQAPVADVALSGQVVIAPTNEQNSVTSMKVRSLNNGKWAAFLLEWDDPTMDSGGGLLDFKDSAAIQFPSVAGEPFYCMGMAGGTVEILHWRADFQRDIEIGMPNAQDIYPNMWVNIYPVDDSVKFGDSTQFLTGRSAGNPLSLPEKDSPVEDIVAGGFGTLTNQDHNDAVGWAEWNDGAWKAVIGRPTITSDMTDAQLTAGLETSLALAAWDGGNDEIDGKKSVSTWLTLKIEGGPQAATPAATTPDTAPAPAPPAAVDPEDDDVLNGLTIVMIIIFAALVVVASTVSWFVARRTTNA